MVVRGACVLDCPIDSVKSGEGDKANDTDGGPNVAPLFNRKTRSVLDDDLVIYGTNEANRKFIYTGEALTPKQIEELMNARLNMIKQCGFMI